LLFPPPAMALDPETGIEKYIHHAWGTREGLPQNTVHGIVQDDIGYLWIGTDLGLVRFDGSRFKTFNKENNPAILNNSITSLLIAKDKTMWIGTYGGGVTRYKDGVFTPPVSPTILSSLLVTTIAEDEQGRIWLGTTDNGILVREGETFITYNRSAGLSSNTVTTAAVGSRGKLWIGTPNGLNCYKNGGFTHYTRQHGLTANGITALYKDGKGDLWVGTANGLNRLDTHDTALRRGEIVAEQYTVKDGLPGNFIRAIREDRHHNLWVATDSGLSRFNRDAVERFTSFTEAQGLSDNALLSLYEDRWGNLWIGSTAGGINVLQDGKFTFLSEQDGLSSDHVKTIFQDKRGRMWLGTNGGGLNRWQEGKVVKTYTEEDGLSSNFIESVCQDREGDIWIGTPNGLNRLRGSKVKVFTTADGLSHNSIKALYADRKENLWIGTYGGGLNRYLDGKFSHYDTADGLSDNFVLALEEDGYGNLWIGTNRGVTSFDTGNKLFRRFSGKEGVPEGMVLDIYCDPQGAVWIATHNEGLIRYKEGKFRRFDRQWGFAGNPIYKILEDPGENLWLSTSSGIFSVPRRRLNAFARTNPSVSMPPSLDPVQPSVGWRHFQEEDGLKTSVCTGGSQPAGWLTGDGKIWFPTIKGIAVMDLKPTVFTVNEMPVISEMPKDLQKGFSYVTVIREQPVIIDKIEADGKEIELLNDFQLPTGTRTLRFHFIAINYRTPGKTLYKFRLIGQDNKWRMDRANVAVYKDLPAGDYEFKVHARTSDGKWSYDYDSYTFTIRHSFFESFGFYVFLTTLLVTGLILLPRLLEKDPEHLPDVKYLRSSLTLQKSRQHLNKLLKIMKEDKPFLDPEMSLQKLSDRVGISKEDLSQVVNEQLEKNFKHFLNEYRVEEAKEKLVDPKEQDFVLMKIAFDVGFNSKSVFNASFKKVTGLTPSQYRKKHQAGRNIEE
jgi:ligand-binding sensor domain-containing protein/AraC-like DNA-binding protein